MLHSVCFMLGADEAVGEEGRGRPKSKWGSPYNEMN